MFQVTFWINEFVVKNIVLHVYNHVGLLLSSFCGLDGPGSIPGVGGVEIFLHSFVSRLALGSTQPPIQ